MIIKELITNIKFKLDESGVRQYEDAIKRVKREAKSLSDEVNGSGTMGKVKDFFGKFRSNFDSGSAKQFENHLNTTKHQIKENAVAHRELRKEVGETSQTYLRFGGVLRALLAGFTLTSITKAADEVAAAKAQISLYADGDKDAIAEQIYSNSQASASSWTAGMKMFGSIARNKAALGMTDQQAVQLSDVVSKAIGMTSQGAIQDEAAILQFGQALGSGTLQGDELRSILENSGGLAKAIADAFGVGVHELKEMGAEGKLTSKALAEGLLKQTEKVNQQYEKMPKTFGKGGTIILNKIKATVSSINEATGASEKFYRMSQYVAENLETIIAIIVGGAVAYYIQGWVTALNLFIGRLWAARMLIWATMKSTLAWAAIFYGLYLIGQDFFVWLQGGNSVLGELIGKSSEWADEIQWVKETFASIVGWLRDGGAKLVAWGAAGAAVLSVLYTIWNVIVFVWNIFKYIRIAMMAVAVAGGPITIVLAAIAAAAYLIYTHWDEIKVLMTDVWNGAKWQWEIFKEAVMSGINLIKNNWQQLATLLSNPIMGSIKIAYDGLTGGFANKMPGNNGGSRTFNQNVTVNGAKSPQATADAVRNTSRTGFNLLSPRVEAR